MDVYVNKQWSEHSSHSTFIIQQQAKDHATSILYSVAFSDSVFSETVFSESVFSKSVFSESLFSESVFSKSVFIQSVILQNVLDLRVF